MARYRGPRLRKCRRLDFAVFESPKFSNPRKNYVPMDNMGLVKELNYLTTVFS